MWAQSVKQAMALAADPLRQRHETVMAQRADNFRKAIIQVLDGQPGIKPRERDRQLRAAAERYAPQTFVAWAANERALEHEWEIRERMRGEIEHKRRMAKADVAMRQDQSEEHRSAIDPPKKANLHVALATFLTVQAT